VLVDGESLDGFTVCHSTSALDRDLRAMV
jgi:hypothetical protein